jgi:hypothetical protein
LNNACILIFKCEYIAEKNKSFVKVGSNDIVVSLVYVRIDVNVQHTYKYKFKNDRLFTVNTPYTLRNKYFTHIIMVTIVKKWTHVDQNGRKKGHTGPEMDTIIATSGSLALALPP